MKTLIRIILLIGLLILLPKLLKAQIDYRSHPQTISNQDSVIVIDWLTSSPKKCPIGFNHLVNFLPMKNENSNSTVSVVLYHNEKPVRSFTFLVGEHANRIYTYDDLNLKRGDRVHFVFKLNPKGKDEQYVFNIYEEPRAAVKTIAVIKESTGQRIPEPVIAKQKKSKRQYQVTWIGRNIFNMQEPIGTE